MFKKLLLATVFGLALAAPAAQAGVRLSIGIGLPIFVPFAPPPRPVYVAPPPVYVVPAPAQVYVRPAPVYVQPAPGYVQPYPGYAQPGYVPAPR